MKGIVFLFLLFCFIWGIVKVVNGIRKFVDPKNLQATGGEQKLNFEQKSDSVAQALDRIKQASDLHRDGVLSDAEFERVKAKLMQESRAN